MVRTTIVALTTHRRPRSKVESRWTSPSVWAFATVLVLALALMVCLGLRWFSPAEVIEVLPFEIPTELQQRNFTGKTVAQLFADQLRMISVSGSEFRHHSSFHFESARPIALVPSEAAKIRGPEYKGISWELLAAVFSAVRYRHRVLTGSVLFYGQRLRIVVHSSGDWVPGLAEDRGKDFALASADLESALNGAAVQFMASYRPALAGTYLLNNHRSAEAIVIFQDWLSRRPDDPVRRLFLGVAQQLAGNPEDAVLTLQPALLAPVSRNMKAALLINLGNAYADEGECSTAMSEYDDAERAIGSSAEVLIGKANVYLGRGDIEPAIDNYKAASRTGGLNAAQYYDLGTILYKKGDFDGAISYLRRAIEYDPKFAGAYKNLGSALYKKGMYAEARKRYQTALLLDADDPETHFNLALALSALSMQQEAQQEYAKAGNITTGSKQQAVIAPCLR
jgi:tetratricopeptide (TPR) repeat protein